MADEEEARSVRLPSGLVAQLQRPDPLWFAGRKAEIELVNKIGPSGLALADKSEANRVLAFAVELIREIVVGPRLADGSLPGFDLADVIYMVKWFADKAPPDGCAPQRLM